MLKLIAFLILNTAATAFALSPNEVEGLYSLSGSHTKHGAYSGQLEIREDNGKLQAIRIITYKNLKHENLKVQEVWTGNAEINDDSLTVKFAIKQADYIVRLNDLRRSPEDFKTPFMVVGRYLNQNGVLTSSFQDKFANTYSDTLSRKEAVGSEPLWVDQRTKFLARGDKIPAWLKPIIKLTTARTGFDKDPYVLSFKHREEFKKINPYIIFDPTDYNFYQDNQDLLRVVNKVIDPISLTESMSRRNSYAFTLDQKADYYEKNMQERHLPAQSSIITSAQLTNKGKFHTYTADFSGALWSGLYAGSQAMRYLSTNDPEALENFKRVLKGLFIVIDITGDRNEFSRSIAPWNEEQSKEGWIRGKGEYSDLMYLPEGNNDMIKGLTHALMWATYIIPESDTETYELMKEKSKRLLELKIFKDKVQNMPAAVGLYAIIHKDQKMAEKFRDLFRNPKIALGGYEFDTTFYVRGSADWSGINLGVVGAINEIMIAKKLGAEHISKQTAERLMDSWTTYESTKRALVTVASYAFAYKKGIRGPGFKKLKQNEQKWQEGMENAMWVLRSVPMPRPLLDVQIDHSMKPEWCLSPVPRLFWKGFKTPPPPPSYFYQGLYDYPIFEMAGYASTYLWKDGAFTYKGTSSTEREHSGADYLYLYWLSRYAGLNWN